MSTDIATPETAAPELVTPQMIERDKRMAQKAQLRPLINRRPELYEEDEYTSADYEAMLEMYNGTLASIEEGVAGLVHISEFKDEAELRAKLELGKVYPFVIKLFEPKERRMTLSFAGTK